VYLLFRTLVYVSQFSVILSNIGRQRSTFEGLIPCAAGRFDI